MNIYSILNTKPNNNHYLRRYVKFIKNCERHNRNNSSTDLEYHHICPKAKDLFYEYANFNQYSWNKLALTYRQHHLAHRLLWKAYGGSQTYAFFAMCNQVTKRNNITTKSSKAYELVKNQVRDLIRKSRLGTATYITPDGNKVNCRTDDYRVLSGEFVAQSKGRKYAARSSESKNKTSVASKATALLKFPLIKTRLYFLDIKFVLIHRRDSNDIVEYLEQGWSLVSTPEWRTSNGIKAGQRIRTQEEKDKSSVLRTGVKLGKASAATRIERLVARGKIKYTLMYVVETNEFIQAYILPSDKVTVPVDIAYSKYTLIKVFSSANSFRTIFDITENRHFCDNAVPTPPGFYEENPHTMYRMFDVGTRYVVDLPFKDITSDHIKVFSPNGDRVKVYIDGNIGYIQHAIVEKYGLPLNCKY